MGPAGPYLAGRRVVGQPDQQNRASAAPAAVQLWRTAVKLLPGEAWRLQAGVRVGCGHAGLQFLQRTADGRTLGGAAAKLRPQRARGARVPFFSSSSSGYVVGCLRVAAAAD